MFTYLESYLQPSDIEFKILKIENKVQNVTYFNLTTPMLNSKTYW